MSNIAVAEERDRLQALSQPISPRGNCRGEGCINSDRSLSEFPGQYVRFGQTTAGSPRYRCRKCGATFSQPKSPTHRLRRPEKTPEILRALINHMSMRRLCDLIDVTPQTLYQRIGLIHQRCVAFAAAQEAPLVAGKLEMPRMHLAIDRQEHTLNSATTLDRRQSKLVAAATTEAASGYVLAQHLNFDVDADPFELELEAREAGDLEVPAPFRRHARLWLPHERLEAPDAAPEDDEAVSTRNDVRAPSRGAVVHEMISLAAHLQLVARMTQGAAYVQLSMDREPSLDRLALLTFADRVRASSADVFMVQINKGMNQGGRRKALADAQIVLAKHGAQHPAMSEIELLMDLIERRYHEATRRFPAARDRWVAHPFPTLSEPERSILCVSDDGLRPRRQLVNGFARASLRSIDRYFMQVRRRIHLLERPISTSSASQRRWYGYSAYSAVVVMRLLEIFRVVYNYHLVGKQGTTAAQRLGLATLPYSLEALVGMAD